MNKALLPLFVILALLMTITSVTVSLKNKDLKSELAYYEQLVREQDEASEKMYVRTEVKYPKEIISATNELCVRQGNSIHSFYGVSYHYISGDKLIIFHKRW